MNQRGQVFTLDMFLALTLTALLVSYSGMVLEQSRKQAEGYALRYTLERTANDAADVLVKTMGVPANWWENETSLEAPGFAEGDGGRTIQNSLDIKKFGHFRDLTNENNWDQPANAIAIEAIKRLFAGSENFEVRVLDENDNELWHAFPRWEIGKSSGFENSLEVVSVKRLVAVKYGSAIRGDTGVVLHAVGGMTDDNLEFEIIPGELDAFDWYIVVIGGSERGARAPYPNLKIYVNRPPPGGAGGGDFDYEFKRDDLPEKIFPDQHGGVENDPTVNEELFEGQNFLGLKFTSGEGWWVRVYVITLPQCSDWRDATLMIQSLPAIVEVKMWK